MRTKTFMSFLKDYVKDMNPEQSLSLFKNEKYVRSDSRLLNVYGFYVFFNQNVTKTLLDKKDKLPLLYKKYLSYASKYKGFTNDNLSKKVESLDPFDELKQLYTSYYNLEVNKNFVLKKFYYNRIVDVKNKKNISNYRIYTDLNLNHGNTNEFFKNKKFEKLSLNNIKKIMNYVLSI